MSRDAKHRRDSNPPSPKKRSTRGRVEVSSSTSFDDFALRPAGRKNRVDRLKDKLFYLQVQRDEWCRKVRGLQDEEPEEKTGSLLRKYENSLDEIDREYRRNETLRRRRGRSSKMKKNNVRKSNHLPVTHRTAGVVFAALKRSSGNDERKLLRMLRDLSGELEDADTRQNGRFTGMLSQGAMSKSRVRVSVR